MNVDADKVKETLLPIPFLSSKVELDQLLAELPAYLASAADTSNEVDPVEWWRNNAATLPCWSAAAEKILLLQPSSAAAERVFSILSNCFGEQQDRALQDYIEASLMLQYNKR